MIEQNLFKALGILLLILLFGFSSFAEEGKTSPANPVDSKPPGNTEPQQQGKTTPDCPPSTAKSPQGKTEDPFQTLTPPLRMMEGELAGEG